MRSSPKQRSNLLYEVFCTSLPKSSLVLSPGRITLLGVALILGGTLFPYNFSSNNFVSLKNSFGLFNAIRLRGNDLLIGADGKFRQPFKGSVRDIRIYNRTLAAAEIQGAPLSVENDGRALGESGISPALEFPVAVRLREVGSLLQSEPRPLDSADCYRSI